MVEWGRHGEWIRACRGRSRRTPQQCGDVKRPNRNGDRMSGRILLVLFVALALAPTRADERLSMRVSPAVSYAPANLRVMAVVPNDKDNRSIEIVAESEGFYRS